MTELIGKINVMGRTGKLMRQQLGREKFQNLGMGCEGETIKYFKHQGYFLKYLVCISC